jgi:hypothetical protein
MIILTLFIFMPGVYARHNKSIAYTDSSTESLFQKGYWRQLAINGNEAIKNDIEYYDLDYRIGMACYKRRMYATSEKYFRKAFAIYPLTEVAQPLYYSLLFQGLTSEAEAFNQQYQKNTQVRTQFSKGTESWFTDIGERFSSDKSLEGDLLYLDFGRVSRPNPKVTLTQSIYYLQQNNPSSNSKQFEYFVSRSSFAGKGWYFTPSLHYAFTMYTATSSAAYPYNDSALTPLPPPQGIAFSRTSGSVVYDYAFPGTTHSANLACEINKRLGPVILGFEPALQVIYSANQVKTNYRDKGVYDSFVNGLRVFTTPYADSGAAKTNDTSTMSYIAQAGGSIGYTWPIKGAPLFSRLSAYYLFDNKKTSANAWNFYTLLSISSKCWLHFSYTHKGALPWAFNSEAQYFNSYNIIRSRSSVTLQFRPLKRFSPMITGQLEQDTRASDNKSISYNSIYLTLKYSI